MEEKYTSSLHVALVAAVEIKTNHILVLTFCHINFLVEEINLYNSNKTGKGLERVEVLTVFL